MYCHIIVHKIPMFCLTKGLPLISSIGSANTLWKQSYFSDLSGTTFHNPIETMDRMGGHFWDACSNNVVKLIFFDIQASQAKVGLTKDPGVLLLIL